MYAEIILGCFGIGFLAGSALWDNISDRYHIKRIKFILLVGLLGFLSTNIDFYSALCAGASFPLGVFIGVWVIEKLYSHSSGREAIYRGAQSGMWAFALFAASRSAADYFF